MLQGVGCAGVVVVVELFVVVVVLVVVVMLVVVIVGVVFLVFVLMVDHFYAVFGQYCDVCGDLPQKDTHFHSFYPT